MHRLMVIILLGVLFDSCGEVLKTDMRGFIEGSFVRKFETEFAAGIDSVVIAEQGADHYTITRYSRFSRIKNGEWLKEETSEEKMAGVYDPEKQVINELKKGKVIHFDPEKNVMLIGASEYRKVK